MDCLEPTVLPYNKNDNDDLKFNSSKLSINKYKIDNLALNHDLDSNLIFLAATCITLTKFTNNTGIFISTKFNDLNKILLRIDEKNREITVEEYIKVIDEALTKSDIADIGGPLFNYIYNDEEQDDANTSLIITQTSNLYNLKLKYDSNCYTYSYMLSFLRSIKRVLNQIIIFGIDSLKIEDIELRTKRQVPVFKYLRNPLVNELLENQACKTPDKIALWTCGESFTYMQINEEANRIANRLIEMGIEKGSSISFMLPRGKTLITTFLGIIKAGCVAVPIDMEYPKERIDYIIENSESEYIITYKSIEDAIHPEELMKNHNTNFPKVSLKPDDPIFILYTSGSTGTPKGVISTHKGISNLTATHPKINYKKLLSIASIAFDISEEDILLSLTNDIQLVFANEDEINDIILLSKLIEKTRPEFVNLTPSRLLSYLNVPEFGEAIKHLKGLSAGGEMFTKNVYETIKRYADIDIYNGYGPLETSLTSNSKKIENPNYITNGKPLLNYVTEVRDIDGKLLPYGVIGELYIGGMGVSKGYFKMEEKTKESFISLNSIPYYKTGDYAVQLPSDEIIIKGRADNQIKLRGQRVDPEEIEQVIIKYRNVNNAIVVVHELNGENHLCAYFTSKTEIDIDDLREYLENRLSKYMVPTFIIHLDKFPQTPNGKIDRKMLPKPEIHTDNVPPANDFERMIYNFCINILNYDNFGVTDNLFNVGFTSLTLMKLNSDIYHEFGIVLKHTDLMANPTVRQISKLLDGNNSSDKIEKAKPTPSNTYPMSSQQKRLYVISHQNPNLTNYNLPNLRKVKSSLDIDKLEEAINNVIDAEEILRTSFHVENGEYIQRIHNKRPIKIDLMEDCNSGDIYEIACQNIRPFNLQTDELIRITIIKHDGETYVFRDMHHIIGDQISNDVLYENIKGAYNGNAVHANEIQYKDYTLWVKKQQDMEKAYWKNKEISDFGTEIFTDFKRPLIQTFNGGKISYKLNKNTIEKLAKSNNTSIYKLLLSQFIILLYKYTNETKIQIGTVTSGRTHPDLEKTLGMFVNTLPFVQGISGEDSVKVTLAKTENELSQLFSNQNYSMERIIDDHKLSSNPSKNPLFSIAFIQNTDDDYDSRMNWDESKFDLTCIIKNSLSELLIEFEYNKDLYSFEKVNSLLKHYVYLIDSFKQNSDEKIDDIDILSKLEKENLIKTTGSDCDVEYDSLLDRFRMCIRQNPSKTILSDDDSSLSYEELDLKSNSLANFLKDKFDIRSHDSIVLFCERSIESVIAFYAILKLNAVYVPVNPLSPEERIRHIVGDVEAKIVLSNVELELKDVEVVSLNQKELYYYDGRQLESTCNGDLAVIHTSGTTGIPKGVQISHENILNFLISAKNSFYDINVEIFYHTTNIGFDTSMFEILFPILNSIRLHVINENYDFTNISQDILNQKSIINTTPSKLELFFTLPDFEYVMNNVGKLIFAGEALTENLVEKIQRKYNTTIYNAYGPCEATIFASIKEITSFDKITIGKSNVNTQIYILNQVNQLCPIGIPGQICIAGKQVSSGYLNQNELTTNAFVLNPFGDGKIYCTGDLAYVDCNGEFTFIGRADSQIKINGQRVEVNEINKQIEKNDQIKQAITVPDSNKTKLYSYIVADKDVDVETLLKDLRKVLLPFMIPASITQIERIPLTNNGKIDVKNLPNPELNHSTYIPPTNETETAIINIWEKVFNVDNIGIDDDFYYLGGDSIKAIRIVSLLQNEGIYCNSRDILNFKTPRIIAQNIQGEVNISYDAVEGLVNLHPMQSYFFDKINRNNFAQEFILKSKVDLDISTLQKAFDELTDLHDMLRATFTVKNGKWIQIVLPQNERICTINELEEEGDLDEIILKVITNANSTLNISKKLMDVSLLHHSGQCYLIFVIHHLIIDGVSWSILIEDLSNVYKHLVSNEKFKLIKPYSYKTWVEDIKKLTLGISLEEKDHWTEINGLLDDSKLKGKSRYFHFYIDNALWNAKNVFDLTEEEYLALGIARAYKNTYGDDIIFNRESHGRDESLVNNLNRTIGWFTSQYPVYVKLSSDKRSLNEDAANLKKAFNEIKHLGLNYSSLIYNSCEFSFKHCPVTFNFLSTEFTFTNEMFESLEVQALDDKIKEFYSENTHFGIDLNIYKVKEGYLVKGSCSVDTYLDEKFSEFVDNIKSELELISKY